MSTDDFLDALAHELRQRGVAASQPEVRAWLVNVLPGIAASGVASDVAAWAGLYQAALAGLNGEPGAD